MYRASLPEVHYGTTERRLSLLLLVSASGYAFASTGIFRSIAILFNRVDMKALFDEGLVLFSTVTR